MRIKYGGGKTEWGPGVAIELTGDEVATAIDAWLIAHGVHVDGPRTVTVNGELCKRGRVYVDPEGFVITPGGERLRGSGPKKAHVDLAESYTMGRHYVEVARCSACGASYYNFAEIGVQCQVQYCRGTIRAVRIG